MANLTKLEFNALDISGKNYLSWTLDADIHLISKGLGETIKEGNNASQQDRAKALIFLCHHLHDDLKTEYLIVKDPYELWTNLKERFDHQRTVVLPKARYEWVHLRLQDFLTVSVYNSELFRITSKLKLCGEKITDDDMLKKTFSTFHASNVLLQQQYREQGFKKYSELISCLLIAEQNNELLMKTHELRPTGSTALPESNATFKQNNTRGGGNQRGRGRGSGYGRGHGHGIQNQATTSNPNNKRQKTSNDHNSSSKEDICHRCGMTGHWSCACRIAKHLVALYQKSIKEKGKNETNLIDHDGPIDTTHLDVSNFFARPEGNIDSLIGGGVLEDNNGDIV